MRVAFGQTVVGYADELAVGAEVIDGGGAAVTHRGAQAAYHLVYGIAQRPLIRHTAFYALGNQLLLILLEVAVGRTVRLLHRAQGTHAAVYLNERP